MTITICEPIEKFNFTQHSVLVPLLLFLSVSKYRRLQGPYFTEDVPRDEHPP